MPLDDGRDARRDRVLVAHVDLEHVAGAVILYRFAILFGIPAGDDHLGPGRSQPERDRLAEPAVAAGDEGDLAVEAECRERIGAHPFTAPAVSPATISRCTMT